MFLVQYLHPILEETSWKNRVSHEQLKRFLKIWGILERIILYVVFV